MKLIGIMGKAGAGKTTMATILAARFSYDRMAFGDALKSEIRQFLDAGGITYKWSGFYGVLEDKEQILSVPVDKVLDPALQSILAQFQIGPDYVLTYRQLMQTWGTEYRRAQDGNYWTTKLEREIQTCGEQYIVVDDVRFPDEADTILRNNGLLVKIVRPGCESSSGDHRSETALDDADLHHVLIWNGGTIAQYEDKICHLLELTRE